MRERTKIRKYTRIEKPFSSRFRVKQYEDRETPFPDWDTVALKNLSAGGMLFNCNKNLEVDSLLDLEIDLSESTPSINCVGKIIRIKESELASMFDIAIEFTEIDKQEREMINITAEQTLRPEQFRPISNTRFNCGGSFFTAMTTFIRRLADLQVHSVMIDIIPWLSDRSGQIVEIGCGNQPYRRFIKEGCVYTGVDHATAKNHFDIDLGDVIYYEDKEFPLETELYDALFHTEVIEHVVDTRYFLSECYRVLKHEGSLFLTVPFQARYHYIPYDYWRFTPASLQILLEEAGFTNINVSHRGSDVVVASYKLVGLFYRHLLSKRVFDLILCPFILPIASVALLIGHISLMFGWGSKDDCLGFSVYATKPSQNNN